VTSPTTANPVPSPGAPTLLLVPTALEAEQLERLGGLGTGRALQALSGFGPVAAAARTASLLARLRPRRVVLLGIAGTYDPERLAPGSASTFDAVALDGVGAGEGADFLSPTDLGLPQWAGGEGTRAGPVHEHLQLAPAGEGAPLLLSVCSAAGNEAQVALRRERFPTALAEDMEGFGVALACALEGVPLTVVRGISNRAGDRRHSQWCVEEALDAARRRALEVLDSCGSAQ